MRRSQQGSGALEYAILITVSMMALITLGHYIKRAAMGRLSSLQSDLGEVYVPGRTEARETMKVRFKQEETFNGHDWAWSDALATEVDCDNNGQIGPACVPPPPPPEGQAPPPDDGKPPEKIVMTYIQTNVDKVDIISSSNEVNEDLSQGLDD